MISPWRSAASTAPGCTRAAGCVPADVTGTSLRSDQIAAASCERAAFSVQTNNTRAAAVTAVGANPSNAREQGQVGPPPVGLGPDPPDQPGPLQHLQMVRQQVRAHPERPTQPTRRAVAAQQLLDDRQAADVTERRVSPRTARSPVIQSSTH